MEPGLEPPVRGVQALDNLSRCRQLLPKIDAGYVERREHKARQGVSAQARQGKVRNSVVRFSSGFREPLPITCFAEAFHSQLSLAEKKQKQKDCLIFGPLAVLKILFENRARVRVVVRGARSVKAIVTGFLKAFDKHCNMILMDVEERRVSAGKWVPAGGGSGDDSPRKRRYMKQLFVRGENVAVVSGHVDELEKEASNGGSEDNFGGGSRGAGAQKLSQGGALGESVRADK